MIKVAVLIFIIFLIGCGAKSTQDSDKNLFSTWVAQGSGSTDDYTKADFNKTASIVFDTCTCNAVFTGNQNTGTIQLSSCLPASVYCNVYSSSGPISYSKVGSALTIGSEHYK